MAGYRVLPEVYDRWQKSYGKDFSSLILPRLLRTIKQFNIPGKAMLDLACGTGTLALMMARRGWKVWGVDASEGMLLCAAGKTDHLDLPLTFLQQDMRELRIPEKVFLVTSFFDSLNHLLSEEDLLKTFQAVRASLTQGGYFVFEVSNERCYETLWTKSETLRLPLFTLVLQNSYEPATRVATSNVTISQRREHGFEERQEIVHERFFPGEAVKNLLEKAGFRIELCEDFNFTLHPEIGKLKTWWVARA